MSYKVHFKLKKQLTKGEKDVTKENISKMNRKRTGLKGGPMRAHSAHHPVHGRLHGLTRHGKHGMGIFKGFSYGAFTFSTVYEIFIYKYNPNILHPEFTTPRRK